MELIKEKFRANISIGIAVCLVASVLVMADPHDVYIGWAQGDITPSEPVALTGQFYKRISNYVADPLTATALAVETVGPSGQKEQAIMVSCDLIWIRKDIQDRVRQMVASVLTDFDVNKLILNATHTHSGPGFKDDDFYGLYDVSSDPGVMSATEYGDFLVGRLALIAQQSWGNRAAGGISWARGHAVTGYNRRVSYFGGSVSMYGDTNDDQFSHVEGYESHELDVLFFFDSSNVLLGMLVNTPVPSQVSESANFVSSDFWHDVRQEISSRYGPDVYVFPQCGAGGDQSPRTLIDQEMENQMIQRRGLTLRQEIARRIANAVDDVYPLAQSQIHHQLEFEHSILNLDLTVKNPPSQPFYKTDDPPVEIHCLQLGEVAIATVPFELYLDYGMRIKGRSQAAMTLISQLSCQHAGYLPTTRAVSGGGYSAVKYIVGPQGGQELVNGIVDLINIQIADAYVKLIESGSDSIINEAGPISDTYDIQLLVEPTQDVVITLSYDDSQMTVNPSTLIFTPANWTQPQTVTVTAVEDGIDEGTHTAIISHTAAGGNYEGISISSITVTIKEAIELINLVTNGDFELPRVQEYPPYWRGWPDGWTLASGKIVIDNEPLNWNQAPYNETLGNQYLVGLWSGAFYQDISVSFEANKTYRLSVDLGTLEGRTDVDYSIELRDVETDTTWARVDQTDYGYPSEGYWDVTAELVYTTPLEGGPIGNGIRVWIRFELATSGTFQNGICADNVKLYVEDTGVRIIESNNETLVDEFEQTSDTYEVELLIEPTEDVTISLSYDNNQLTVIPETLHFLVTNWNQPQTVTVTAVEDGAGEGAHESLISHSVVGGNYEGIPIQNVLVSIEEGYPPPPSVQLTESDDSTIVNEFGQLSDSYDAQLLAEPNDPVTISLLFDSNQIIVSPSELQFDSGNWTQSQTVTVTAVEDGPGEGSHISIISHSAAGGNYEGIPIQNVLVSIEEGYPPPPSVQLTESDDSTIVNEFGQLSDSYDAQLLAEPNDPVTISLLFDSNQIIVSPSELQFDSGNWTQSQTVTVTAVEDGPGEGTHVSIISHSAAGGNYEGIPISSITVTVQEVVEPVNLIINGDFELPRVQELPPYWRGWPNGWTLASGKVIIDNEPSKWNQSPYNEMLGNQYLVGLWSGAFYQDISVSFEANKTYRLSVDLGTLEGRTDVDYSIELRDVETDTTWARVDQTDYGYPSEGYWDVTAELVYNAPLEGGPIGNEIRVWISLERAASGVFKNGICADNVKLSVEEQM